MAIDMGVKNFGFCRLQLDKNLPFNKPPTIKEWKKFDLTGIKTKSFDSSRLDLSKFEPQTYSRLCHELIENVIFNSKMPYPDIVLIERQRTRNMSSKNIQEWVMKVNLFESMLFGMTYSKFQRENPSLIGNLLSVNPQRMGSYYKSNDQENSSEKTKKENVKSERIKIVERWLRETIDPNTTNEPWFYLDPIQFPYTNTNSLATTRSKSKWINELILGPDSKLQTGTIKGDDLVDSLLHALSWIEWERNKMILKMELMMDVDTGIKVSDGFFKTHIQELKS